MSDLTTPWGRLKDTATFLQLVASQGGPLSGNAMEHARRLLVELDLLKAERPEGGGHGWKIVPIEATTAMKQAAVHNARHSRYHDMTPTEWGMAYAAMIHVAPPMNCGGEK